MKAHTKDTQAIMTPAKSLQELKDGNSRFQKGSVLSRDLMDQMSDTSKGQFPFATVLSCIDSRVSSELIFDQGIGDIFSVRIAGNFVNQDILGSMEFACKLAGTKLILVLGHTSCGAVKGACDDAKLGNLTDMLAKIKPAVNSVEEPADASQRNSGNIQFVNMVSAKNVELNIQRILDESPVLAEMKQAGDIQIVGGMYDIQTGAVEFY
ncbi:carbonic anhydrase family protein [Bacteroidia bacterium]|nr:carbonic anhydrase family protein [Bacteroidia bacterium]MDB9882680.1 carbonic anhydrase family protein [Bacteroidia bacterium]MDC1395245.1 carbonic anhydrase family protein [Bacteroidia bacterium]